MSYTAHLNGGPRDDTLVVVEEPSIRVVMPQRLQFAAAQDPEPHGPPYKTGRYNLRRNFDGSPVPHDLTGAVEFDFDWKNFDA